MKKHYTILIDGKLYANVVDDMNSTESWAIGGIIFLSKKAAKDCVKNLKSYDYAPRTYEIVEVLFQ